MSTQTGYFRFNSSDIHLLNNRPQVDARLSVQTVPAPVPQQQQQQQQQFSNTPTPSLDELLFRQIGGRPWANKTPSLEFEAEWNKRQPCIDQSESIGLQLFKQVASAYMKMPVNSEPLRRG